MIGNQNEDERSLPLPQTMIYQHDIVCAYCHKVMRKVADSFVLSDHPPDSVKPTVIRGGLLECKNCGAKVYGDFGNPHSMDNNDKIIFVER